MEATRSLKQRVCLNIWYHPLVDTSHCTLHTAYCTLHTAHCTLHTAHCKLHTLYCTLQTVHFALNTAHCTLRTAHYTLQTAHWTLYTRQSTVDITHCTAHSILHSANCAVMCAVLTTCHCLFLHHTAHCSLNLRLPQVSSWPRRYPTPGLGVDSFPSVASFHRETEISQD